VEISTSGKASGDHVLIANLVPDEIGWSPIQHMVTLASELLDARVVKLDRRTPSRTRKLLSVLNRRAKRGNAMESCLMICPGPADLLKVLDIQDWRRRFKFLAAWIIDSYWLDHIPMSIRLSNPFDHFFVTSLDDLDAWKKITGVPTTWLPWGTDALRLGRGASHREWDITRVGRQPPEWDDDLPVTQAAESLSIKYAGRPSMNGLSPLQNLEFLMKVYGNSKYILAFSNSVNPEDYTHPTRQYLTGRWVDALGCGATVAGIAPRGPGTDELLWPGATLDLGSIRRTEGLEVLAAALKRWTMENAAKNNLMALKKLDWRWRYKVLAEAFGFSPAPLVRELKLLQDRIAIET
jgi:hypothetical protein